MSFYDDSTLMFLAAGAVGKDGKASTIKPVGGGAPLYVTRGSNLTATRVDSNGLIEKGRENLLKDSNSFNPSGTAWNPTTAYTLTSGQEGYDGYNNAWLLDKLNTLNDYHQQRSINGMSGNVITESIYAKAGTEVGLVIFNSNGYANWNLSSGTLIGQGGNAIRSNIESVGNGWYRCSLTVPANSAYDRMMIKVINSSAGDSSGSIYIQDAQVELGLVATEYIESGATTGLAGILEDSPRFDYSGGASCPSLLLEPSRTQLLPQSEYLEGYNQISNLTLDLTNETLSPEGLNNSYSLTATSTSSLIRERINPLASGTYTFSFYAKYDSSQFIAVRNSYLAASFDSYVWFDIRNKTKGTTSGSSVVDYDIEDVGNGWVRCYVTTTSTSSGDSYFFIYFADSDGGFSTTENNKIYSYGWQVEQGSYPTSYIPNHSGGSVSREFELVQTADVSSSNLIGQNEGVFFLDFEFLDGQTAENQNWIALESENGNERVLIYKTGNNTRLRIYHVADNVLIWNYTTDVVVAPNTRYKAAFKYSSGDMAVVVNGNLKATNSITYTRGSDLSRVKFNESNVQPSCRVHQAIVLTSGWDNLDLAILTGLTDYYASFSEMATALNYTIYE